MSDDAVAMIVSGCMICCTVICVALVVILG